MALNCTSVQRAFVPGWETRGNDITPSGWTGQALIGTSMFSKVALMLSSCLNKLLFGGKKEFLCEVYAWALPSCPQTSCFKNPSPKSCCSCREMTCSPSDLLNWQRKCFTLIKPRPLQKFLNSAQISTFLRKIRRPETLLNAIQQLRYNFSFASLHPLVRRFVLSGYSR